MKKFIFGICLSVLVLLTSCSLFNKDKDSDKDIEPDPVVELKEIKVVDLEGTEITKVSVFQALKETDYTHPDVYVWAYYTDDTHKDVTKDATFSTVDLTVAGNITVTVTYEEKTDTYTLEIKENKVVDFVINPSNVKNIYQVGSVFDPSGLVVRGTYTDETVANLVDYNLEFKNSSQAIDQPLKSAGTYTVSVSHGTLHQEFEILVYDRNYHSTYDFQIDSLKDRVTLSETGSYTFENMNVIQTSGIVLNFNKNTLVTKNEAGEEISHKFNSDTYTGYVGIPSGGITLTLSQKTDIFLVVGSLEGATLSFTSLGQSYPCFGHSNNYTATLYCSLPAGTYTLEASDHKPVLYDISFNSVSSLGADTPRTYVLNVNSDAAKKSYTVGEPLDATGLMVSLETIPATTSTTINPNTCQYEIRLNNSLKNTFDQVGTYQVQVKYNLNSNLLQDSYTVFVVATAVQYVGISLDTSNVTTSFLNSDSFQYNHLVVKANTSIGFDVLSAKDFIVKLYDPSGNLVSSFTTSGTYTVEVSYIGQYSCSSKTATYMVSYTKLVNQVTCEFEYFGPNASSFSNYTVSFDPTDKEDVKNCIQIPQGYAFLGFSSNIYDANDGDFFKVYIDQPTSTNRFVVLLDEGYCYPASTNYYEGALGSLVTVPQNVTSPVLSAGVTFVGWDIPVGATITDNLYYLPIISELYPTAARVFINANSTQSFDLELQNVLESVIKYEIQITKNGLNLQSMMDLKETILISSPNDIYKISGAYYGILQGTYYRVELDEIEVNATSILALQSIDVSENTILNVSSTSFDIQISSFISNCPNGYQLSGFEVIDDEENLVQDILYTDALDSLYVTGLNSNKKYKVVAYYDLISESSTVSFFSRALPITEGYRIHFVGYYILTSGAINHRVRILYQEECLYRFYIADGDSISNWRFESIMLPIHLENYSIVGTTSNLTNILSDIDAEAILVEKNQKEQYNVVFYDFNGTVISNQVVQEGKDATPPTLSQSQKEFFVEEGSYRYKYVFTGWPTNYTNVTAFTCVSPRYERYDYTPPAIHAELMVGWDFLILRQYTTNGSSVVSSDIYAVDAKGQRVELMLTGSQKYTGVLPSTFYTLYIDYTYLLPEESEPQVITKEFSFTTLGTKENYRHDVEVVETNYCSITLTSKDPEIEAVIENVTEIEDIQIYDMHTKQKQGINKDIMSINNLDVNATYQIYYILYIDGIYYIYNDPFTATTEDMEPPVLPTKIYVEQPNQSDRDIYRVYIDQLFLPEGMYCPNVKIDGYLMENGFRESIYLDLSNVIYDDEKELFLLGCLPVTYPTYNPETGEMDEYIIYYHSAFLELYYTYNGYHTVIYSTTQAHPSFIQMDGSLFFIYGFMEDYKSN